MAYNKRGACDLWNRYFKVERMDGIAADHEDQFAIFLSLPDSSSHDAKIVDISTICVMPAKDNPRRICNPLISLL